MNQKSKSMSNQGARCKTGTFLYQASNLTWIVELYGLSTIPFLLRSPSNILALALALTHRWSILNLRYRLEHLGECNPLWRLHTHIHLPPSHVREIKSKSYPTFTGNLTLHFARSNSNSRLPTSKQHETITKALNSWSIFSFIYCATCSPRLSPPLPSTQLNAKPKPKCLPRRKRCIHWRVAPSPL